MNGWMVRNPTDVTENFSSDEMGEARYHLNGVLLNQDSIYSLHHNGLTEFI